MGPGSTIPGSEIGRRDPTVTSLLGACETRKPDPGHAVELARPAMRKHLKSNRRELQGRSPPIESYEAPQGRQRDTRRGFSPSGFPLQVADFGPPHHPSIYIHRRWGSIGSRGIAADRDRQEGAIAKVSKG